MFGLGFILGPVMGGLLGAIDLRLPFFAAGSLALLNLLYGFFVLPESLPLDKRRPFSWRAALNPIAALTELGRLHIKARVGEEHRDVAVRMGVDEAGRDHMACGVDRLSRRRGAKVAHLLDPSATDADIGAVRGAAGPVHDEPAANDEVYCWRARRSALSPICPRTRARCRRYIWLEDCTAPPAFLYADR